MCSPVVSQLGWSDVKAHIFSVSCFSPSCIRNNLFSPFLPFRQSLVSKLKSSPLLGVCPSLTALQLCTLTTPTLQNASPRHPTELLPFCECHPPLKSMSSGFSVLFPFNPLGISFDLLRSLRHGSACFSTTVSRDFHFPLSLQRHQILCYFYFLPVC